MTDKMADDGCAGVQAELDNVSELYETSSQRLATALNEYKLCNEDSKELKARMASECQMLVDKEKAALSREFKADNLKLKMELDNVKLDKADVQKQTDLFMALKEKYEKLEEELAVAGRSKTENRAKLAKLGRELEETKRNLAQVEEKAKAALVNMNTSNELIERFYTTRMASNAYEALYPRIVDFATIGIDHVHSMKKSTEQILDDVVRPKSKQIVRDLSSVIRDSYDVHVEPLVVQAQEATGIKEHIKTVKGVVEEQMMGLPSVEPIQAMTKDYIRLGSMMVGDALTNGTNVVNSALEDQSAIANYLPRTKFELAEGMLLFVVLYTLVRTVYWTATNLVSLLCSFIMTMFGVISTLIRIPLCVATCGMYGRGRKGKDNATVVEPKYIKKPKTSKKTKR